MGRRLKTTLPAKPERLLPESPEDITGRRQKERSRIKKARDKTARNLGELAPGETVRVQDHRTGIWNMKAQVQSKVAPRFYEVLMKNGYLLRRNRRALRSDPVGTCRPEVDPDLLEEQLSLEQALETAAEDELTHRTCLYQLLPCSCLQRLPFAGPLESSIDQRD